MREWHKSHSKKQTLTETHTETHTQTHTDTHTNTHRHSHTHTHTQTHTHSTPLQCVSKHPLWFQTESTEGLISEQPLAPSLLSEGHRAPMRGSRSPNLSQRDTSWTQSELSPLELQVTQAHSDDVITTRVL